jgi:copper chaperone
VENMSCAHCRRAVEEAVRSVDPAAEVAVDLEAGRVRVTSAAPAERIAAAIAAGGYPAEAVA